MKILLISGTGAMGSALVDILAGSSDEVIITTRQCRESSRPNVTYLQGDSSNDLFVNSVININYHLDVIVDFGNYSFEQFLRRREMYLLATDLYVFISSARIYAQSNIITEDSCRLYDTNLDIPETEYAIYKAKSEDALINSRYNNWTIIRPYITYNNYRMQLGVYEKEQWLVRILRGKSVVIPKKILRSKTTLTYAIDVALRILNIIYHKEESYRQVWNIASEEYYTWREILNIYIMLMKKHGISVPDFYVTEDDYYICRYLNRFQYFNDRLTNRRFNSGKIDELVKDRWTPLKEGLRKSMDN